MCPRGEKCRVTRVERFLLPGSGIATNRCRNSRRKRERWRRVFSRSGVSCVLSSRENGGGSRITRRQDFAFLAVSGDRQGRK